MSAGERQLFFENICRTCMAHEDDAAVPFQSIFSFPVGESLRICELLHTATKQRVDPSDGLPSIICSNCLKSLVGLYGFQQMSLKSEARMRAILEQHKAVMPATAQLLHLPHAVFDLADPQAATLNEHVRGHEIDANDLTVGDIKNYSLFDTMLAKHEPDAGDHLPVHTTAKRRPTTKSGAVAAAGPPAQPKPRKIFTIAEKTNIIRKLESGMSNTSLARELGISHSTISTIWKNRDAIVQSYDTESNQRRRLRASHNCDIEQSLLEWIKVQRHMNVPLNGTMIQLKANEISKALGRDYYCTESWVYRFRVRHNIDVQKVQRHNQHHGDAMRKTLGTSQLKQSADPTRRLIR